MNRVVQVVRVGPGHRVEVVAPELNEGDLVNVTVSPCTSEIPCRTGSVLVFLDSLPPGPRAFPTWDEYEQHLQKERNSWDQ